MCAWRTRGAPELAGTAEGRAPEEMTLIELEGVARRYDMGEVTVTALKGVDLRIERGELIVVLGPSPVGSIEWTCLRRCGLWNRGGDAPIRLPTKPGAENSRAPPTGLASGAQIPPRISYMPGLTMQIDRAGRP